MKEVQHQILDLLEGKSGLEMVYILSDLISQLTGIDPGNNQPPVDYVLDITDVEIEFPESDSEEDFYVEVPSKVEKYKLAKKPLSDEDLF